MERGREEKVDGLDVELERVRAEERLSLLRSSAGVAEVAVQQHWSDRSVFKNARRRRQAAAEERGDAGGGGGGGGGARGIPVRGVRLRNRVGRTVAREQARDPREQARENEVCCVLAGIAVSVVVMLITAALLEHPLWSKRLRLTLLGHD